MKIGYFADGLWAHRAFEKIVKDASIKIVFMTVRYDRKDKEVLKLAEQNNIPIELNDNINSKEFIGRVKTY